MSMFSGHFPKSAAVSRLNVLYFLVLVASLISACKPKDSPVPVNPVNLPDYPLIHTVTYVMGTDTTVETYTYDDSFRVIKVDAADYMEEYEYDSVKCVETYTNKIGVGGYVFVHDLNAQGLVWRSQQSGADGITVYFYDAQGLVTSSHLYDGPEHIIYEYSYAGNDLVKLDEKSSSGTLISTTTYTFDNSHMNSAGPRNRGQQMYGRQNDHVWVFVDKTPPADWDLVPVTYIHQYDQQGRLSHSNIAYGAGYVVDSYYAYY